MAEELPVEDLKNVEIFKAGTHTDSRGNKTTWTVADLHEMVKNFENEAGGIKPIFKLMHLNPKDHLKVTAMPSLGRFSALRVVGTKLVADFARVPRKVAMLIRAGSFNRISAEIFRRFRDDSGRIINNVVSAAGLLGALHPAVTLKDVLDLFEIDVADNEMGDFEFTKIDDFEWEDCYDGAMSFALATHEDIKTQNTDGGEKQMDAKELQAFEERMDAKLVTATTKIKADADKEVAEFKSSINEALGVDADSDSAKAIKTLLADNKSKGEAITEAAENHFSTAVDGVLAEAVKAGKMLPAEKASFKMVADKFRDDMGDDGKLTFELSKGKEMTGEPLDILTAMFEARPKVIALNQESGKTGGKENVKSSIPSDLRREAGVGETPAAFSAVDKNAEVEAYMKEHRCGWIEAFEKLNDIEVDQYQPEGAAGAFSVSADGETLTINR